MKKISEKVLSETLSLYIDGELDEKAKLEFEQYLASHRQAAAELDQLRKQQSILKSRPVLPENVWFWQRFSSRLRDRRTPGENLLPFSRKYLPLAAALTVVICAFVALLAFVQRSSLTQYLTQKKEKVQELYAQNLLQGKLFPLFAGLNKDQVLQFALFGTLPIDAQAKTALRVDESREQGARIEVAKSSARQHSPVTVEQFCSEVNATPAQQRTVDSILLAAKDKIEKSVFLGENKALAVHPDLVKYNRMTMSHLAAALTEQQQQKFRNFLVTSHSPYTFVVSSGKSARSLTSSPRIPPPPHVEQFVVITPDSCTLERINIDLSGIRRNLELSTQDYRNVDERAHALMRELSVRVGAMEIQNPSLKIFSDSDYFTVKMENSALSSPDEEMPLQVIARAPGAMKFRYEIRGVPDVRKLLEDDSEFAPQPAKPRASSAETQVRKGNAPLRRGLDLDSLINARRDKKSQPRINQNKKRYNEPFEL